MSNVKFLLQKNVFYEEENEIEQVLKNLGFEYKFIEYNSALINNDFYQLYPKDSCVIFYGSINLARIIKKKTNYVPGVYLDDKKLNCNYYYPRYYKYLLNNDYCILPFGDLVNQKEFIKKNYVINDNFFIRPNNCIKSFTGQLIRFDFFEKEINSIKNNCLIYEEDLVLISSYKKILEEYRFVIINGQLVTGSLYLKNDEIISNNYLNPDLINYMERICLEIKDHIEKAYTIDISFDGKNYRVIELNSFSSSGLYSCDKYKAFKTIADCAYKEWVDYYEF